MLLESLCGFVSDSWTFLLVMCCVMFFRSAYFDRRRRRHLHTEPERVARKFNGTCEFVLVNSASSLCLVDCVLYVFMSVFVYWLWFTLSLSNGCLPMN